MGNINKKYKVGLRHPNIATHYYVLGHLTQDALISSINRELQWDSKFNDDLSSYEISMTNTLSSLWNRLS